MSFVIQLHGYIVCNFILHYGFKLHVKVSSCNILTSISFTLSIMLMSLTYLTTLCHVIHIVSYNFFAQVVFVNSVDQCFSTFLLQRNRHTSMKVTHGTLCIDPSV